MSCFMNSVYDRDETGLVNNKKGEESSDIDDEESVIKTKDDECNGVIVFFYIHHNIHIYKLQKTLRYTWNYTHAKTKSYCSSQQTGYKKIDTAGEKHFLIFISVVKIYQKMFLSRRKWFIKLFTVFYETNWGCSNAKIHIFRKTIITK